MSNEDTTTLRSKIGRGIRKRLGLGHDQQTRIRLQFDSEDGVEEALVGPFVKTEFPEACAECGEQDRYFHAYWDSTGFFTEKRHRCHECYVDRCDGTKAVPVPREDGGHPVETAYYTPPDPRDLFEVEEE